MLAFKNIGFKPKSHFLSFNTTFRFTYKKTKLQYIKFLILCTEPGNPMPTQPQTGAQAVRKYKIQEDLCILWKKE